MSSQVRQIQIRNLPPGLASSELPADLLKQISFSTPGQILKPGSRSTVTRLDLESGSYVFKTYKKAALHRRIRYALTRSRARQSWEMGLRLTELGFPVVSPLALFEEKSLGIPSRALLIMPFQGGLPITETTALEPAAQGIKAYFTLARKHLISHGDLKGSNILISPSSEIHFIDIDASQIHPSPTSFEKAHLKDQTRFLENFHTRPADLSLLKKILFS